MKIDTYKLADIHNLTKSEGMALEYIVNNFENSLKIGVRGVAKQCYSSTSVIMNLAKKLGYSGFIDMVYRLHFAFFQNIEKEISEKTIIDDEKVKKFISLISDREKPIFIHGVGFSSILANYMVDKLMVLGHYSMRSEYIETMINNKYSKKAILILISKSGETSSLFLISEYAKNENVPIILFTGNKNSKLAKEADIIFEIKDSNPSDDRNLKENDFFGNTILYFESLISLNKKSLEQLE